MIHIKHNQTYNSIDLVKFICSILVVMIHIPPFGYSENNMVVVLNYGIQNYFARIAVPFFFVASGYFLYRKTIYEEFSLNPTKKYVVKLFRLYMIWSIIYLPLVIKDYIANNTESIVHNFLSYIRNIIFSGSYHHLWYLNASIFSVVALSYMLYRKVSVKKIMLFAFIMYCIGLLAQSWFGIICPIQRFFPAMWEVLRLVQKVIVTTRNGLFEGLLFVGIGMWFAYSDFSINIKKSVIGFTSSMILMLVEAFVLKKIDWVYNCDMYLFLVPVTFFFFALVKEIELTNSKIFIILRQLSALIFYMHLWIKKIVSKMLRLFCTGMEETFLVFLITLIITIMCSMIIIKMSEKKRFKWIKKLYE